MLSSKWILEPSCILPDSTRVIEQAGKSTFASDALVSGMMLQRLHEFKGKIATAEANSLAKGV